jgi:ankyrin repeat protein
MAGKTGNAGNPLIAAIMNQNSFNAILKLVNRSSIESITQEGYTPLMLAVRSGDPELVDLLISKGANVNHKSEMGETALHIASYYEVATRILKSLITAGAKPNSMNNEGYTPLMYAGYRGNLEYLTYMSKNGGDLEFTNQYGDSVYSEALRANTPKSIAALRSLCSVDRTSNASKAICNRGLGKGPK